MATGTKTPTTVNKSFTEEIAEAKSKFSSKVLASHEVLNTRQDGSGKWYVKFHYEINGQQKEAILMDSYADTAIETGQITETEEGILVDLKHENVWYNADGQLMITKKGSGGFKF